MKKVGIIGGGIAGLTCAYRLAQKGINCVLFDESAYTGGKIEYCVSVTSPSFQPRLDNLVGELGLGEAKNPFPPTLLALLYKTEMIKFEELPKMMESFSDEEKSFYQKITGEAMKYSFDVADPSPELAELRKISFDQYLKDCPPKLKAMVIDPLLNFAFEPDFTKLSADYGLFHVRFAMEMGSGKAYTFEENLKIVANVLEKKIMDSGSEVSLSSKVERVEKEEGGFKIYFRKRGEEKTEKVEKVVFATPLFETERIFPELKLPRGVEYRKSEVNLVRGKPKTERKVIMGIPAENEANIRLLFQAYPSEHQIYPVDLKKEIDPSALYEDWEIIEKRKLEAAYPILVPKGEVPSLKNEIEGVYLCGDFYYYPSLETAIASAEMVAGMIS